jgi:hypothetical protein
MSSAALVPTLVVHFDASHADPLAAVQLSEKTCASCVLAAPAAAIDATAIAAATNSTVALLLIVLYPLPSDIGARRKETRPLPKHQVKLSRA